MSSSDQPAARAWVVALVIACALLAWSDGLRLARVLHVTGLAGGNEVATDAGSPTGYAGGRRVLIVPEPGDESYQWIAQTQQMLVRGEWRVRHVDYDNAPVGRDVHSPSPYRWWLGALGWCGHVLTGRPLPAAVERAALFADPLIHVLLLFTTSLAVRRWFGALPAAVVALGWAVMYPLAGAFLPGQPGDLALSIACACWSVLPLLAGVSGEAERRRRRFILAGIAGGLGLWVNVAVQFPIVMGIALGAVLAAWCERRANGAAPATKVLPPAVWRPWALAGAVTSLAAYAVEYLPSHWRGVRLEYNHPLYALAWWGAGELAVRAAGWVKAGRRAWSRGALLPVGAALGAIAALPAAMLATKNPGFLIAPPLGSRLSNLPGSAVAAHLFDWLAHYAGTPALWTTVLPGFIVVAAAWLLWRRAAESRLQAAVAVAGGAAVVALGFAAVHLWWWQMADALLLLLLAATVATVPAGQAAAAVRRIRIGGGLLLLPGLFLVLPAREVRNRNVATEAEIEALLERDLAYWLANQAGPDGAIVLAPPGLTVSLFYHGGLRGLGTPYRENNEGLGAAVRIAAASSPDEGQALARRRELTHVVIPSWDPFLDEYARLGTNQPENSLVAMLHRWLAPRWLRPVPYQVPNVSGSAVHSATIFQVVEAQDNATALSRLGEYFLEMNQNESAAMVGAALEKSFPADLNALVARAQIDLVRRDTAAFDRLLEALGPYLERSLDEPLPFDRRVSLAYVLAQAKRYEEARRQVDRCLEEIDETSLRSLTTLSLYRLRVLLRGLKLEIPDPALRALADKLLPPEMRAHF